MIPWLLIDTATMPDGGGDLRLMRRGEEFSIMSGAIELMNSRVSGSEEALATLTCRRLEGRSDPHVLIGGFGMGFTLRAALASLGRDARVTVGELVPAVIAWARGPMEQTSGQCLMDPRVTIREGDVADLILLGREHYDAILLDVDNGPEGLTRKANDRLYDLDGLAAVRKALRPLGVLAVWSSSSDAAFTKRLQRSRFNVEEVRVRATGHRRGSRHVIWLATKSA
jgi:spermidine synthase